jgi:cytochrome P450
MARKPKLAISDASLIEMDDASFTAKREALMLQLQEMEAAEHVRVIAHAARRRAESLAQRQEAFTDLMSVLNRLAELDSVPPAILKALTSDDGQFAPQRFLKRPRS